MIDDASAEQEEHVVEQALAERHAPRSGSCGRVLHDAPAGGMTRMTATWLRAYVPRALPAGMTAVIWGLRGFVDDP